VPPAAGDEAYSPDEVWGEAWQTESGMRIGVVRLRLHLHGPTSLKEKRQVLQSLMAHLRRRFNVSIAEVDRLDDWKSAVLGAAIVCNDGRVNNALLGKLVEAVGHYKDITVEDYEIEIL
jgi:uncharacterized protein YlxP (DUF503 family)